MVNLKCTSRHTSLLWDPRWPTRPLLRGEDLRQVEFQRERLVDCLELDCALWWYQVLVLENKLLGGELPALDKSMTLR